MTARLDDVELLGRLVAFDSTSRNSNLPLTEFLCDYLERPGVRIRRNPSPDGQKTNLLVAIGPEEQPQRAGLVLSGHMDVVPADEDEWGSDPFTLTAADDAYVGRGACDMKGFLALAANRLLDIADQEVRRPLMLLLTYDEEVGTRGAKHFAETWNDPAALPRATIIGEPTSLKAIRLHKGHLQLRIVLLGKSAHSGYPHLGVNAIEPMGRVIASLAVLRTELEREGGPQCDYFPEVPFVALNAARIDGGTAVNIVPDRCMLEVGIRLLPGMDASMIVDSIREVVRSAAGETPFTLEIDNDSPPMILDPEAPIYRSLCADIGQRETHSASYATDAGWLQSLGLDCVIFGPGSIEVAHKPNEFMPAGEFKRGGNLLAEVVHRHCILPL